MNHNPDENSAQNDLKQMKKWGGRPHQSAEGTRRRTLVP